MKAFLLILSGLSLMFAIVSGVLGVQSTQLRSDYSWNSDEGDSFEQFERDRADLHLVVQGVSVPYFLVCGVAFGLSLALLSRRVLPIIGIVISLSMLLWSFAIGPGASFDEVFPAWILAALVLGTFQLILGLSRPRLVEVAQPQRARTSNARVATRQGA